VHVIWHYAPGVQRISLAVKAQQGVLGNRSQSIIPKKTRAVAAIEEFLNSSAPLNISFLLPNTLKFFTPMFEHSLRKRIEKMKTDVLRYAFAIKVRKVAA